MEKKKNVDATILEILSDESKQIQVTPQTREIIRIISANNQIYSDLLDWVEKYFSCDEQRNDEIFRKWDVFRDCLNEWLLASITDKMGSLDFKGI